MNNPLLSKLAGRMSGVMQSSLIEKQLEKQEYRCYFTGFPLTSRTSASIDRKDSRKQYGAGAFYITLPIINMMRKHYPVHLIVELARRIVNTLGDKYHPLTDKELDLLLRNVPSTINGANRNWDRYLTKFWKD